MDMICQIREDFAFSRNQASLHFTGFPNESALTLSKTPLTRQNGTLT
jgi:hypothetical protein